MKTEPFHPRRTPALVLLLLALLGTLPVACSLTEPDPDGPGGGGPADPVDPVELTTAAILGADLHATVEMASVVARSVDSMEDVEVLLYPEGAGVELQLGAGGELTITADTPGLYVLVLPGTGGEAALLSVAVGDGAPATGLEVEVTGVPAGSADVSVTNHTSVAAWLTGSDELGPMPAGRYQIAAGPVRTPGGVYLPGVPVRSVDLVAGEVQTVTVAYEAVDEAVYADEPDFSACDAGSLTDEAEQRVLARLNFVRGLSGLPAVVYDSSLDPEMQETALVRAQNPLLPDPHHPDSDALCYSPAALSGASTSNLSLAMSTSLSGVHPAHPEIHIDQWFVDRNVSGLGHRRWNLAPALGRISFGMSYGRAQSGPYENPDFPHARGAAMKVVHGGSSPPEQVPPFVAYPLGEFPTELLASDYPYHSFSVVPQGPGPAAVDFAPATVNVLGASGSSVAVTNLSSDYRNFGISNSLQWELTGARLGEHYLVLIQGVLVEGEEANFAYTFVLR